MAEIHRITVGGRLILDVDADPSGAITAPKGSIALDSDGGKAWVNSDGATAWVDLSVSGGGGVEKGAEVDRVSFTVPNNTTTKITGWVENRDNGGFFDATSDDSSFVIPAGEAGRYLIVASTRWVANATGVRQISITDTGQTTAFAIDLYDAASAFETRQGVVAILDLAVSDTIAIAGFQTSGGDLGFNPDRFSIHKLNAAGGASSAFVGATCTAGPVSSEPNNNDNRVCTGWVEEEDSDDFFDAAVNDDRFVIPAGLGGMYRMGCSVNWAVSSSGRRTHDFRLNSTLGAASIQGSSVTENGTSTTAINVQFDVLKRLADGDFVTAGINHTAGGNLNMTPARFWIFRVGD